MSDAAALIVEDDGCIRHLIFNRPERLNAIDLPQHERVIDAIEDATNDRRIKVIAFSGAGRGRRGRRRPTGPRCLCRR